MRSSLDALLKQMDKSLIEMGKLCENALSGTSQVLKTGDEEVAKKVIDADDLIDNLESKIDSICLTILLREQPFARDLRRVIAATKMVTDMERIGDQAADIADILLLISGQQRKLEMPKVSEMASKACKMVADSVEAFVTGDLELIKKIIQADDEIDELFEQVKDELEIMIENDSNEQRRAIDIVMVTKYLERIADHATNVAEWVEFSITGVHPSY